MVVNSESDDVRGLGNETPTHNAAVGFKIFKFSHPSEQHGHSTGGKLVFLSMNEINTKKIP